MPRYAVNIEEFAPAGVREEQGWHQMDIRFIVTRETVGSTQAAWWRTVFPPGAAHRKHIHHQSDEILYGICGRGAQGIGDTEVLVEPGVAVFIPKGAVHWMRNLSETEPLEIVGIYAGVGSLEESGYEYVGEICPQDRRLDLG